MSWVFKKKAVKGIKGFWIIWFYLSDGGRSQLATWQHALRIILRWSILLSYKLNVLCVVMIRTLQQTYTFKASRRCYRRSAPRISKTVYLRGTLFPLPVRCLARRSHWLPPTKKGGTAGSVEPGDSMERTSVNRQYKSGILIRFKIVLRSILPPRKNQDSC